MGMAPKGWITKTNMTFVLIPFTYAQKVHADRLATYINDCEGYNVMIDTEYGRSKAARLEGANGIAIFIGEIEVEYGSIVMYFRQNNNKLVLTVSEFCSLLKEFGQKSTD
jgi:hypothetical protein